MTTTRKSPARGGLRGFLILTIIVVLSGALLWSQGDLISPVQSTSMLLNLSSGGDGFAMVGEGRQMPPASTTTTTTSAATTTDTTAAATTTTASTGSMTLDEFTAALSAAGVDVEAVSATMSAEGRSLDNLLAVVNSGRTTVAELATRLQASTSGETANASTTTSTDSASTVGQPPSGERDESSGLLNFQWNALGSVAYNLWFILATTILVILAGRPVGWLVNRINNRTTRTSAA